ncbi:MAG: methionyl-tRNA formyltransferase [Candidatus Margulisbacteria bacterium GWF2_35_9]|nr:MAG: methionyl-tRNA formyltransferase [Candidatus Margulisbacteria bacterium GWF2_35_9]
MFKNILFLGTPKFAETIFSAIYKEGIIPKAVISMPDRPKGRKNQLFEPEVKQWAKSNKLSVYQPASSNELRQTLKELQPDLLIVIAYGMIFPPDIVDEYLLINVHASILPKYRGASPIQATLLSGDMESGVTLIKIAHQVDNGDIISIKKVPIEEQDNLESLNCKLEKAGIDLLKKQLDIPIEKWKYLKQEESGSSYTYKIKKEDGYIEFGRETSIEIIRKLRAYTPWPGVYTIKDGKRVKILDANIKNGNLVIQTVQLEGKNAISYSDFINGFGSLF